MILIFYRFEQIIKGLWPGVFLKAANLNDPNIFFNEECAIQEDLFVRIKEGFNLYLVFAS